MGDQATNALVAIVLGTVLAVLLLIPTAAVQYRLDGRLGPLDLTILVTLGGLRAGDLDLHAAADAGGRHLPAARAASCGCSGRWG